MTVKTQAGHIRTLRNKRLVEADVLCMQYLEKGLPVPKALLDYKEALRNLTKEETFPDKVFFPTLPDLTSTTS